MKSWTIKLRRSLLFLLIIRANFGLSQEKVFVIGSGSVNDLQMRSGSVSYIENRSSGSLDPSALVNRKLRILKTSVPNFGFIPHDVWFRTQLKTTRIAIRNFI